MAPVLFFCDVIAIPYFENDSSLATADASIHATEASFYFCMLSLVRVNMNYTIGVMV